MKMKQTIYIIESTKEQKENLHLDRHMHASTAMNIETFANSFLEQTFLF